MGSGGAEIQEDVLFATVALERVILDAQGPIRLSRNAFRRDAGVDVNFVSALEYAAQPSVYFAGDATAWNGFVNTRANQMSEGNELLLANEEDLHFYRAAEPADGDLLYWRRGADGHTPQRWSLNPTGV